MLICWIRAVPATNKISTTRHLTDQGEFSILWVKPPETASPPVTVIILPGANCRAERYLWLAQAFAGKGWYCLIIDPPETERQYLPEPAASATGRYVSLHQLMTAFATVLGEVADSKVVLLGHSLGGSVILEALDPEEARRNPNSGDVPDCSTLQGCLAAITMGATLQPELMGTVMTWRRDHESLSKAGDLPLLMLAGEDDRLAPPGLVQKTFNRYSPPKQLEVLVESNHFGWTTGNGDFDRQDLDGVVTQSRACQQAATIDLINEFVNTALTSAHSGSMP